MPKICLIRNQFCQFEALTSHDFEIIKKIKEGIAYQVEIKLLRNPKFHRKAFALLNLGFQNSRIDFPDFDTYRKYALIKSGHHISVDTPKGKFITAKSLKFTKMDEIEFERVYNDILNFIILDIGATKEVIETELINFI